MRWSRKPNNCSKVPLLKASRMTVSNRRQVPQKAYPLLAANGPLAACPISDGKPRKADILSIDCACQQPQGFFSYYSSS